MRKFRAEQYWVHPPGTDGGDQRHRWLEDPDVVTLRRDLVEFRVKNFDKAESIGAARQMSRLPWPMDRFQQRDIDAYELKAAVSPGDTSGKLPELVSVLGDSRLAHWARVNAVAYSANGSMIASAGNDGVRLWDATSGQMIHMFPGGSRFVAFSPNNRLLSTGRKVWNLDSGVEVLAHRHGSVAFSPDSAHLAVGISDGSIQFWDVNSARAAFTLKGHKGGVSSAVAFSSDGKRLASSYSDRIVKVWDIETRSETTTIQHTRGNGPPAMVESIAFSPNGERLATGGTASDGVSDNRVKIWDIDSGRKIADLGHAYSYESVSYSHDGKMLAASDGDSSGIHVWDVGTGIEKIRISGGSIHSIDFSPDGKTIVSGGHGGNVEFWDVATGKHKKLTSGHRGNVTSIAVSPDGRRILSAGYDRTAKQWNVGKGVIPETLNTRVGTSPTPAIALSPDGTMLAVRADKQTIDIHSLESDREVLRIKGRLEWIVFFQFSPDGKQIAYANTGSGKSTIEIRDLKSNEVTQTVTCPTPHINSMSFNIDGSLIASFGYAGAKPLVTMWNSSTGTEERPRSLSSPSDGGLAFRPGGRTLATIGTRITEIPLRLWDLSHRQKFISLRDSVGGRALAFSPDGDLLATAELDGTIRIWDPNEKFDNLLQSLPLAPRGGAIRQIRFTPDGRHLVSANSNGTIYLLRLKEWSAE